ncbi:hypothetical protein L1887_08091 [Cichorium endivia]|nr:hypothetical protein L1887_08091 [Cichorium endivia]
MKYSLADSFLKISEGPGDMIKHLANEPSVGLFYVQQHTHKAISNLVNLKNDIAGKSHEIRVCIEESQDSIRMVRSMKEYGYPIVSGMINDITKSLAIISSKN